MKDHLKDAALATKVINIGIDSGVVRRRVSNSAGR